MEEVSSWKFKLSALDKRIKSFCEGYRQNIAILGDEEDELSYLLDNYFSLYKLKELVYIHTNPLFTARQDFFKSISASLLGEYLQKADTLDNLISAAASLLPSTTSFIRNTLKKNTISFLAVLEVINNFINESGKKCVFIIEEFLELDKIFPKIYQDFSKFIILQRNCMVVLTSSLPKQAEKVFSNELNLLFGNFEKIYLTTPFLNNYLYLKSLITPLNPSPFFISFFISIINSNVLYYDLISKSIRNNYLENDEIGSIISIIEDTLYFKETYFFQKFIKKIKFIKENFRDHQQFIKILLSLSDGYLRKKELVSLGIGDPKELGNKLTKLVEHNYIENLGNIYKIKDCLFSFWLSFIFRWHLPLYFDPLKRKILWRRYIEEGIHIFKEDFFKDRIKKVLELVSCFKDDRLRVGKDKYKLPLLNRVKVISYSQKNFYIIIGEGKEVIFIGLKDGEADDSDVVEFIEKGKSFKNDRIKKIFISLDRLSPTAKLIAKNHRLTIWEINELNRLLNIYNKANISL